MAETAAARALRLIDLVPYLVSNPGISVKETATKFGVSVAELLKDLDLLFVCGLPGYTPLELIDLSVEDGVISIRDPQNLEAPRRFSESEALVMRVALSALEDLLPATKKESVRKLREKLSKLYSAEIPKDALFYQGDPSKEKMRKIEASIKTGKKLKITYLNPLRGERTNRAISVIRVKAEPKRTLIDAWCDASNGVRTFNLGQIEELEVTKDPIEVQENLKSDELLVAKLKADSSSYFVAENQAQLRKVSEGYEIEIFQPEWLVRKVLAEGGSAQLVEPNELSLRVKDLARKALALYS
ncbi:MAG: WYL domain-containing protein [Actinomycetota bacterium]